jgi:hypothetical protein
MSSFNFTSILNSLSANGVTGNVAGNIISHLALQNSAVSTTNALFNQLVADSASPAAVAEIITKIETTEGVPPGVVNALESLRTGNPTQMQVLQAIPALEAAIAAANPSVF